MAALTGNLLHASAGSCRRCAIPRKKTNELLDLSCKLTAATDRQAVISAAAHHLEGWSDLQLCLLNRDGQGDWKVETGGPITFTEAGPRRRRLGLAARSAFAGISTGTFAVRALVVAVVQRRRPVGFG